MGGMSEADQSSNDNSNKAGQDDRNRDAGCHDGKGGPATGPDGRGCDREGAPSGPMPTERPADNSPFPY